MLHPDGRDRPPHLRSFRDGWRHLRFMLMCTPTFLFILPGLLLTLVGLVAIPAVVMAGFGDYTDSSALTSCTRHRWLQSVDFISLVFGLLAKYYAHLADPVFRNPRVERSGMFFSVERGLTLGASLMALAVILGVPVFFHWVRTRQVPVPGQWIFAGTLFCLGLEAAAGILVGILECRIRLPMVNAPRVIKIRARWFRLGFASHERGAKSGDHGGREKWGLSQMRRTGADSFTSGRNGSKRVATHVLR